MTTKQRSDLLRLFEQGRSITDSARCVGVCRETARELAVSVGYHGYGQGKRGPAPKKYYTVYLNMDDSIVTSGTARECAKQMGKSENSFRSMISFTRSGKNKKYTVVVEEV